MIEAAVKAIRAGRLAIVPTDTVYGLAASPYREEPVRRLYRAKGREELQPTAIVAADLELLFECVPELRGRSGTIARALLPGPYTLVLPNPARRYRWLTGSTPDAIGVRVPAFNGPGRAVLEGVGVYVATSANLPGGPDPSTLDAVPDELKAAADAIVDGGALAGTPSTVLDLTGPEPVVLREGAVPAEEALRLVASVV
ncbi:MAG: threonylcarbamoyl-AMP synthase [Actinobacteria bacterium]|nr:threonylcarbamoyl-AMP synthase [Actinomycetota bacterium]